VSTDELRCQHCGCPDVILVEIAGVYDGWLYLECTICALATPRDFGDWTRLNEAAKDHAERHNARHA